MVYLLLSNLYIKTIYKMILQNILKNKFINKFIKGGVIKISFTMNDVNHVRIFKNW